MKLWLIVPFFTGFNLFLLWAMLHLRQKKLISQFLGRKLLHLLSAFGAAAAVLMVPQPVYLIVVFFFTLFYFWLWHQRKLKIIDHGRSTNLGLPLYPVGLLFMATFLWFNPALHLSGILILGLPDVIGAAVEEYLKSVLKGYAALVKSLAYFTTTSIILAFAFSLPTLILVATILTLVESASKNGLDNFTVPFSYTLTLLVLASF